MKRTKMDEIVENMANYICDHICQKPKEITDQEELEAYCAEECEIGTYICNILNQYNEIRAHHDVSRFGWCRMGAGLGGFLGEDDGCSRGRKVSESDT